MRTPVDLERRQVAGVDSDHLRAERNRPVELVRVVRLDQHVEAELARIREQLARTLVVDVSKDQQHRVGAGDLQLQELDLLREKPLREQWDRCRRASCAQVVERAAETLVDEHRDRRGPGVSELQREACRICVRPEVTG